MTLKKAVVLCEGMYEERELWYPYYRLKEAGYEVSLVGPSKEVYTGKSGLPCKVDVEISQINKDEITAVIIPGGYAPDRLRKNEAVLELVKTVFENKGLVASICHGPWVLVSADILKGKALTCFPSIKDDVVNAGGKYEDKEVVTDDNLVTSRMPADLPAFMQACLTYLDTVK